MKRFMKVLIVVLFVSFIAPLEDSAAAGMSKERINELLSEKGIEANIPPEILKAIASQESRWNPDFEENGRIGLMGVKDSLGFDNDRLRTDVTYNIDRAIEVLNDLWESSLNGELPVINDADRHKLQHWYFVIMAYDGLTEENLPSQLNEDSPWAYQEEVYISVAVGNRDIVPPFQSTLWSLQNLPFEKKDFTIDEGKLTFNKMTYSIDGYFTESRFFMNKGDILKVYVDYSTVPFYMDGKENETIDTGSLVEVIDTEYKLDFREGPFGGNHSSLYKVKALDGTNRIGYIDGSKLVNRISRLSGPNRFETADNIALEGWKDGADTIIIAQGNDFPDALAGAPLAAYHDAPILLVPKGREIQPSTLETIKKLHPTNAILLGGSKIVSDKVESTLRDLHIDVERVAGADRFETAKKIADLLPETDKAILAYGFNFPDALAVAPYAANDLTPILLTGRPSASTLPKATEDAIQNKQDLLLVGGKGVISEEIENNLGQTTNRLAGKNRYSTSKAIIDHFQEDEVERGYVATGRNFADALTGSMLAAKSQAPLILADQKFETDAKSIIELINLRYLTYLGGAKVNSTHYELLDELNPIYQQ
ncbi:cell wall-binding repeat-containing protein [Alkalihalobacillus sp. CinArs1]|uniref:cell wall-binding repeat-containing protein n=1 Tax=Alkalihalobacillus sp. CinArs1 TaxID=2995314 RepID=UPI0022DD600E|nr:cell wall-binding repeat-containing protein [Alkalihalobacillus sp. CinArs1]